MNEMRLFVVLLFSIALPYSATANMLGGMHRHHDGLGAPAEAVHQLHNHGTPHAHHADTQKSDGQGCDCSAKCRCQNHCAGGGCASAMVLQTFGSDPTEQDGTAISSYRGVVSDPQRKSPFRPPISAPPCAA